MLNFLIGWFIGGVFGFLLAALLCAAGRNDDAA